MLWLDNGMTHKESCFRIWPCWEVSECFCKIRLLGFDFIIQ